MWTAGINQLEELLDLTQPIDREFFERPADVLAPELLGTVLLHGKTAGMLVETEAYLGLTDLAAHSYRGLTERTKVMFGPAGYAYVYLIYGMYECLNVVADKPGIPHCVLVRALQPLIGIEKMLEKLEKPVSVNDLCNGPGKLTRALGITRQHYGVDLCTGSLRLRQWKQPPQFSIEISPRIGISECVDWPLRFTWAGHPCLSRK